MRMRTLSLLVAVTIVTVGLTVSPSSQTASPTKAASESEVGLVQQMYFMNQISEEVSRVGLIWKRGIDNQEKKLEAAKRAVASVQGKLFVGYVEGKGDVAEKFRLLTREHDVQVLWVLENDGVVDASAPREYLIKNSIEEGIPLVAPTEDWVNAGAPVAFKKVNGEIQILLNEPAAKATAVKVPDKHQENTRLIASADA